MCGRYTIATKAEDLEKRFNAKFENKNEYKPRFNAAPSQNLPIILSDSPKIIKLIHWGLHYSWMDKTSGRELINIRGETLEEKQTFKKLLLNQRCLILSDGFYEWKKVGSKKMPYRFILKSRGLFAFAGLWDEVKDKEGNKYLAYVIITTAPNKIVASVHNRMPVILERKEEPVWLNGSNNNLKFLNSCPDNEMNYYPVSTLINRATNDSVVFIEKRNE